MSLSRFIPCISNRAAVLNEMELPVVSSNMPAPSFPKPEGKPSMASLMKIPSPGWAKLLAWKKAPPPVELEGAAWMNQYKGMPEHTLVPGMVLSALKPLLMNDPDIARPQLELLARDIHTMLALYSDNDAKSQQKAADRYFRDTYARLFKKTSYTFEDEHLRRLMTTLRNYINDDSVHQAPPFSIELTTYPKFNRDIPADLNDYSAHQAPPFSIDLTTYPGFNRDIPEQAYQRILDAYLNTDRVNPLPASAATSLPEPVASTSKQTEQTETAIQVTTATAAAAFSNETNKESLNPDQRIRQEVSAMKEGNIKFETWLANNNIEAVKNSGTGLNCLIIALLQHATGAYGNEFENQLASLARQLRRQLGIAEGMLFSDDATASRIVNAINNAAGTNMVLVEVQADDSGQPVISMAVDQILSSAGDKVAIWQKGNHFEALRAKDVQPAS